MYTRRGIQPPWARTVAQPMGRDNGSHTTYLVSEAMYFSISRTDRSNELRLVPRAPRCIRRGIRKLTVGALWLSPWGDNGSHTTYLVSEAMYFSPSYLEPTVAMSSD
jgi:hypothetical protein